MSALISCTKTEIIEDNFISMEKCGNEVLLQSSVSAKEIKLNAVEAAFFNEDTTDMLCIRALDKIRAKDAYVSVSHLEDKRESKSIKNFSIREMQVGAALILPYEAENGAGKAIKIPFNFIRQMPSLNGDNCAYDIHFEVSSQLVELKDSSLEFEFEIILKEEAEKVGQCVIRKKFALKTQEIDFDVVAGEYTSVEVSI
ncbi:MAG: hypothetical protein J6W11_00735 [Alphaproteobacteria bacterium]|nr:hypothetical protein [Alphaproteobacteria bacterium]